MQTSNTFSSIEEEHTKTGQIVAKDEKTSQGKMIKASKRTDTERQRIDVQTTWEIWRACVAFRNGFVFFPSQKWPIQFDDGSICE